LESGSRSDSSGARDQDRPEARRRDHRSPGDPVPDNGVRRQFSESIYRRVTDAMPIRPLLIRLNNEIRFGLFGETPSYQVVRAPMAKCSSVLPRRLLFAHGKSGGCPCGCYHPEATGHPILLSRSPNGSVDCGGTGAHIRDMRTKLPILVSVALLASAIMLLFRDELHARDPHRLNTPAMTTECGFWGDMSAGMSCR
jgi:hypothetical protein